MSFTKHNNLELPDGGVQNWDASLNENFSIIEKGPTIKATAGLTIAIDKVAFMNQSERLELAISPAAITTSSQFLGIATAQINREADGYIRTFGHHSSNDWSWNVGPVYMSPSTAGDLTQTKPARATMVGYAITTNEIVIRPWVEEDVTTAHDTLSGLLDPSDDHTQYLAVDNRRSTSGLTVTGNLQVDGNIVGFNSFRKNALINGDFNISQRGTQFPGIADTEYSLDRYIYNKVGTMGHTVIQDSTDVPTFAESNHKSNYSIRLYCSAEDSSIAAGDYTILSQRIEGFNFAPLAQKPITLSFWHKHTLGGTYCVAFQNSNSDRSYVSEYKQDVSDTWEKAEINISASPSAGTWDYTTGVGLRVIWTLASGTTFQDTPDTWHSTAEVATANQINACNAVGNNFRLSQVQLEQGNNATDFEYRDYPTELNMCKRYYEELNNEGLANFQFGVGHCISTTGGRVHIPYVEKRSTPTCSVSAAGDFTLSEANGTLEDVTVFSFVLVSKTTAVGSITVASDLVTGDVTRLIDDGGTNSRIKIKAEL